MSSHRVPDEIIRNTASTNANAESNASENSQSISNNLNIVGSKSTTPAIIPIAGADESFTTIGTISNIDEYDDLADLRKPLIEPDNMIDLTVKTLDSQNHPFHVEEDITIRQFKEKISESLHIPPDSQRLIFCGRVLQDDKRLSEYALSSGNTVHMVQRAPPQAAGSRPSREQSGGQTAGRSGIRRSHTFRMVPPNIDRNAMYLGAMAYPADLMEAQGIQLPQPSTSLCASRLNIARRMLRRAGDVLSYLENPGSNPPRSTPSPTTVQVSQAVIEVGIAEQNVEENIEESNVPQDVAAAAIAATVSAAQEVGVPNITIFRRNPANNQETVIHIQAEEDGSNGSSTSASQHTDRTRADSAGTVSESEDETILINIDADLSIAREEPMPEEVPPASGHSRSSSSDSFSSASEFPLPSAQEAAASSSSTNERPENNANTGSDAAPTRAQSRTTLAPLATLLDELNAIQTRLQPFMRQYHSILLQDPNYSNVTATVEAQRVFNRVSQIMHLLSHAYHAISDLMVDLNNPPPRYLRCRPILIQHSAVVQAGIPIHAEINLSNMNDTNGNNNRQQQSQSTPAETPPVSNVRPNERPTPRVIPTASAPSFTPTAPTATAPPTTGATTGSAPATEPTTGNDANANANNARRHFGFSLPEGLHMGGNVEVVMEVSPGFSGSFNTNGAHTISGGNGMGVTIPFAPPSGEVLANIMQAVAGQIMNRMQGTPQGTAPRNQRTFVAPETSAETSSTSSATTATNGTNNAAGQNSQARVNTATHPTTSTQTRSTARPHVQLRGPHMHLGGHLGGALTSSFDPFLPCNSHHLRGRRAGGSSNNNNNTASTQPAQGATAAAQGATAAAQATGQYASRLMNELSQQLSDNRRSRLAHQIASQTARSHVRRSAEQPPADTAANVEEPTNTILEFLLTIGRVTQLEDILTWIISNRKALFDNICPTISDFICSRLFPSNPDSNPFDEAAEFLTVEIQPYLGFLQSQSTVDNIDLIASVTSLSRSLFPDILRIAADWDPIRSVNTTGYGNVLLDAIRNYLKLFCGILIHSCHDGIYSAEKVFLKFKRFVEERASTRNKPFVLNTTRTDFIMYLRSIQHVSFESVRPFLKKRSDRHRRSQDIAMDLGEEDEASRNQAPTLQQQPINTPAADITQFDFIASPAELSTAPLYARLGEPTSAVSAVPVGTTERQATLPPIDMDVDMGDSVTNATVGSQPWHSAVPSDWVPIISRDTVRQRRQNLQPPFSDAYLQTLPSKRRKLIASDRPSTNVERAIQEGVRAAVDTVPHRDGPAVSQVATQAAAEPSIQVAYREQLRSTVRTRLQQDPDFTPEKYPNTDKFFK